MSQHSSFNRKRKSSENFEKENKKRKTTSKEMDLPERFKLTDLPEVPILLIASFLTGDDLLKFSHLNRQLFHICNSSSFIWKNVLKSEGLTFSKIIRESAKSISENCVSENCVSENCVSENCVSDPKQNVDKLSFLLHVRTKGNWKSGKISRSITLPALQGHPGKFKSTL